MVYYKHPFATTLIGIGMMLMIAMLVWAFFMMKNKSCLTCFGQAMVVFLGMGVAIIVAGYGYNIIKKANEASK